MITARRQKHQRLDALRSVSFFAHCTKSELERIDALGTQINVAPGRILIREGTDGQECFVTLKGVAVATRAGHPIGEIGPRSIAGEMALHGHTTRNATVVAKTPMQLLVLDQREFAQLMTVSPHIEAALQRIIDERRNQHHAR
jgi:CRP-like cAMP-binding protein